MLSDKDAEKIKKMIPSKAIPRMIIFIFVIWLFLPLLLTTGAMSGSFIFPIIAFVLGAIVNILFLGLIIYAFVNMIKISTKKNELPEAPKMDNDNQTEQEEIPDNIPEEEYMMQTNRFNEEVDRRIYEKEIFPYEHPKLYIIQKKVIPFIWFLTVLCIIITILAANGIIEIP